MTVAAVLKGTDLFCLADASPGDCVAITGLVFESLGFLYPARGFSPGDQLRCIGLRTGTMHFETLRGVLITLDRFYACFVKAQRTALWSSPPLRSRKGSARSYSAPPRRSPTAART